jgi:DHA3 family macrolide efflux protein-like MFS transporter
MVPEEKLSRINGINFLFTGLIQLVGPPLAALLFQFFGNNVELVLWVDVITFLIAIIPLLLVKIPQVIDKGEESLINSSFIGDFKVGLKTLTNIPGLVILVLFSMLINFLLRPINILLPYFINSIHGGFSFDYALVEILFNIGIIGGAIVTSIKKQWNRKIQIILLGVILIGFFYGILKFIPIGSFLLIGFTLLLLGLPLPIINSIYQSILQVKVPKDKMGRVLSIDQGISMMFSPLGSIIAGPLAVFMGTQNLFLFCGITMIFLTVLVYFLSNLTHLNYDEVKADMKITIGK